MKCFHMRIIRFVRLLIKHKRVLGVWKMENLCCVKNVSIIYLQLIKIYFSTNRLICFTNLLQNVCKVYDNNYSGVERYAYSAFVDAFALLMHTSTIE